ncbi:hypothetical protein H4R20_002473 [Coemansia guatemalensis]|uniref:carboxypeptidase C n=1 Tax=Coemansia guatemalensis TaxID=2761395 RepID=A0A9W8I2E9_9FUNG|nr:hypothetical protein H4R20_002473 [Coemansia guatemalensis]
MTGERHLPGVASAGGRPNRQIRIKSSNLCDANVTQYSGYIDVAEDKHLFFWFFEARNNKREDSPLILWLNGGPGQSSMTGLMGELGPCRVNENGNSTTNNPYAWNDHAHVLFLDQPTNVGFSYGADVLTTVDAANDVHLLLLQFYKNFPEYTKGPLHVFGQSYGGHYVPAVAKAIHDFNKELLDKKGHDNLKDDKRDRRILPLSSIGIGNGLVNPLVQYKYYSKMACDSTYPAVISKEACNSMEAATPICEMLIQSCNRWNDTFTCSTALEFCVRNIRNVVVHFGQDIDDIRLKCDDNDRSCYPHIHRINEYLNNPKVQDKIGAEISDFTLYSTKVYEKFALNGDEVKSFDQNIPPLLADGIRVLVYAGDADYICNWYGNKAWTMQMEWPGQKKFNAAKDSEWHTSNSELAGEVRTSDNLTFIRVFEAGHMVPYDKPAAALDMINRWIDDKPF